MIPEIRLAAAPANVIDWLPTDGQANQVCSYQRLASGSASISSGESFEEELSRIAAFGSDRSGPTISTLGGEVIVEGLTYRVCAVSTRADGVTVSSALLDHLFLKPDATQTGPQFSWKYLEDLPDPSGGRRVLFQLTFGGQTLINKIAKVLVNDEGVATSVQAPMITQDDQKSLQSLALAEAKPPRLAEISRVVKQLTHRTAISATPAYLEDATGYREVFVVETGSGGGSEPDESMLVARRVDGSVDLLGLSVGNLRREAAAPGTDFGSGKDSSGTSQRFPVTVVGGKTYLSGHFRQEPYKVFVSAQLTGSDITSDSNIFDSGNKPEWPAAIEAYIGIGAALKGLMLLGMCSYDGNCSALSVDIDLRNPVAARFVEPDKFQVGHSTDAKFSGGKDMEVLAHELVHAIIRRKRADYYYPKEVVCTGLQNEGAYTLEESIADTLGAILIAIEQRRGLSDVFGFNALGNSARSFRNPIATKQPTTFATIIPIGCDAGKVLKPTELRALYANTGPLNSAAYRLVMSPADKHLGLERDEWMQLMGRLYLKAASFTFACLSPKSCSNVCEYQTLLRTSVLSDPQLVLRKNALYALIDEALIPSGLTKCVP